MDLSVRLRRRPYDVLTGSVGLPQERERGRREEGGREWVEVGKQK